MNAPALPLTEAQMDRLELLLEALPSDNAMALDEVQGFLCATLAGPVPLPHEDRLLAITGEEQLPPTFDAELGELSELIARWTDALAVQLTNDEDFPFVAYDGEEGESKLRHWCFGYLSGVDASPLDWFDNLQDDEQITFLDDALAPLLILSGQAEEAAQEHGEEWPTGEDALRLMEESEDLLTEAIVSIDAFWRAKRSSVTLVRTGPKVGRNDPCPCGSGKKFKQCCSDE